MGRGGVLFHQWNKTNKSAVHIATLDVCHKCLIIFPLWSVFYITGNWCRISSCFLCLAVPDHASSALSFIAIFFYHIDWCLFFVVVVLVQNASSVSSTKVTFFSPTTTPQKDFAWSQAPTKQWPTGGGGDCIHIHTLIDDSSIIMVNVSWV